MENCRLRKLVENFRELYTTFHQMLSIKNFSKCEHLFRKVELFFNTGISFSQGKFLLAGCEVFCILTSRFSYISNSPLPPDH